MQVALVTGVSRGLGEALARVLLDRGYEVVGIGRHDSPRLAHPKYRFVGHDLADVDGIDAALGATMQQIAARVPASVSLVNNAAVAAPAGAIGQIDAGEIARALAVNLAAPAAVANLFCRHFASAPGDRRIVNVSSGAAHSVLAGSAMYCAAKAGLEMLTRVIAAEQGAEGIRAVSLRPGILDTDMQLFMRSQPGSVLPTVAMFQGFHDSGQLVQPDTAAARIADRIIAGAIEQGRQYSYSEL